MSKQMGNPVQYHNTVVQVYMYVNYSVDHRAFPIIQCSVTPVRIMAVQCQMYVQLQPL